MDSINTAASLLSAPPLAAPCGSQQRFQRPLLPATLTKLSPRDQLVDHEERVGRLEQELADHRANPLPAKAKAVAVACYREKDAHLHFEVLSARFSTPLSLFDFRFPLAENALRGVRGRVRRPAGSPGRRQREPRRFPARNRRVARLGIGSRESRSQSRHRVLRPLVMAANASTFTIYTKPQSNVTFANHHR